MKKLLQSLMLPVLVTLAALLFAVSAWFLFDGSTSQTRDRDRMLTLKYSALSSAREAQTELGEGELINALAQPEILPRPEQTEAEQTPRFQMASNATPSSVD